MTEVLLLIFLAMLLTYSTASFDEYSANTLDQIRSQCRSRCLQKHGRLHRKLLRNGHTYEQLRCNEACQPCWAQCDMVELFTSVDACRKKCQTQKNVSLCEESCDFFYSAMDKALENHQRDIGSCNCSVAIKDVSMICVNLQGSIASPTASANFLIRLEDESTLSLPIVYHVELRSRIWRAEMNRAFAVDSWRTLGSRTERVFQITRFSVTQQYQLRAIAVLPNGTAGDFVESDWIKFPVDSKLEPPAAVSYLSQSLVPSKSHQIVANIAWTPSPVYPSCFYRLAWQNEEKSETRSFTVDEQMEYVLDDLDYDSTYTVLLRSLSCLEQTCVESRAVSSEFQTHSCLELNENSFTLCPPGSVLNLSLSLADGSSHAPLLSWQPPLHTSATGNSSLSGYFLKFRSLPHITPKCSRHLEFEQSVPANFTALQLPDLTIGCAYSASLWPEAVGGRGEGAVVSARLWRDSEIIALDYNGTEYILDVDPDLKFLYLPIAGGALALICLLLLATFGGYALLRKRRGKPIFVSPRHFAALSRRQRAMQSSFQRLLSRVFPYNTAYLDKCNSPPNAKILSFPFGRLIESGGSTPASLLANYALLKKDLSDSCLLYELVEPKHFGDRFIDFQKELQIVEALGEGAYGAVCKANLGVPGLPNIAAVKRLKDVPINAEAVRIFDQEIAQMSLIGYHPNIVCMFGRSINPPALILEYCPFGDLKRHLKCIREVLASKQSGAITDRDSGVGGDSGPSSNPSDHDQNAAACSLAYAALSFGETEASSCVADFLIWAKQVALAMEFLSSKGMIHRDLAARNVLLTIADPVDRLTAKISDFGLTRKAEEYVQLREGKVPWKWLAIESLSSQSYTTKSDVWSFGIFLWELASVGADPYPDQSCPNSLRESLGRGDRMAKPANCSDDLYAVMADCWQAQPENRPDFTDLNNRLEHMIETMSQKEYLKLEVFYKELADA